MFFALLVAEQLIILQLGSYPYRWGFLVARRTLPKNFKIEDTGGLYSGRLKIRQHQDGNIYMRYKYYPLSWGPCIYVGQVSKENPTELIVRLGPLTTLSFTAFIVMGLLNGLASTIFSLVFVSFFIWYYFKLFLSGYEKIILRHQEEENLTIH